MRIEKLLKEKNDMLDSIRDMQDELQILRNPVGVTNMGSLNNEMEVYIDSMNNRRKEQQVALRGLKVFMDTITSNPDKFSDTINQSSQHQSNVRFNLTSGSASVKA